MFIALLINIYLFIAIKKTEQLVIKHAFKDLTYTNKYLRKWKQKVINHLTTNWYFLNLFNIEVWIRSVSKNLQIVKTESIVNQPKDRLSTIIADYYAQMHPSEENSKKDHKRQ